VSAARFSVRQHILVNLLFYLCMLAGLVMLARIPVDFFPDISFNTARITTEWIGASADEIERLITTKIEDEIEGVTGIKALRSTSSSDASSIEVEWDETMSERQYSRALADLRASVDRVADLPEDAEEPVLRELSVGEIYASVVVAVVDDADVGEATLRAVANDLRARLDDLPGIRRVSVLGERARELRVEVDRYSAMAADLTLPEIADVIRKNNRNVPAGSLRNAAGETTVRATGNFTTAAELGATIVKKSPDGAHIHLRDLATVEPGFEKQRLVGRYNGRPAMMLQVAKEKEADILDMVAGLRRLVEEREAYLPAGVRTVITQDGSHYVGRQIQSLRDNLILGIGAVIVILWFTLGFRNALLAIVALPFSYLTAVVLFPVLGITINSVSIVGMILVSGMLVDDAIIVLENIYRHIEEGRPVRDAVIGGAEEVAWPVIASVSTTIAAFSPLLLISGTSGEFMAILPKTVIVCLVASLLECLFTLPAHYISMGSRGHAQSSTAAAGILGRVRTWSDRTRLRVDRHLDDLRTYYRSALVVVLANRGAFAALLGGMALFTAGLASRLPIDMFANEYRGFFIAVYGPTTNGVEQTHAVMRDLEKVLLEFPEDEILDFSSYAGMAMNPDTVPIYGSHLGVIFVGTADTDENREHPGRILQRVRERVDAWWAANRSRADNVLTMPPRNGPPLGKPVAVQIKAEDYKLAKQVAREMKAFLVQQTGAFNVEDNLLPGPHEIRLNMDEARASIHGLTFDQLAVSLRGATDGLVASTFKDPAADEDVDIRVLWSDGYRRDARDLLETEVRAPAGHRVPLGDVADIDFDRGYLSLTHHDARRSVIVYADVVEGVATSESVNRALQKQFADLDERFPDVEVTYGGEFQETARAFEDLFRVFPLAILLIYIILAAQFRSYLQPLLVMTAVPFGVMGVLLGLSLFGYTFSFPIIYGIVGLSGVVVNDSLVLVAFINRARGNGVPLYEAVLDAGQKRLRPVLLTTSTTVAALLPTALGLFGRTRTFSTLAAGFASGLTLATLFTLFVVPAGYYSLGLLLEKRDALRRRSPAAGAAIAESGTVGT
jgi:HAE1 family hydrophobic/amphiphilic exporter-1